MYRLLIKDGALASLKPGLKRVKIMSGVKKQSETVAYMRLYAILLKGKKRIKKKRQMTF